MSSAYRDVANKTCDFVDYPRQTILETLYFFPGMFSYVVAYSTDTSVHQSLMHPEYDKLQYHYYVFGLVSVCTAKNATENNFAMQIKSIEYISTEL